MYPKGLKIRCTYGFKRILLEIKIPKKLWVDKCSALYNKTFESLLKELENDEANSQVELYSIYRDL